jgi:hypothetical protein
LLSSLSFSFAKWPSKEKFPQHKDNIPNYFFGGISLPREPNLDTVIVWACACGGLFFNFFFGACGGLFFKMFSSAPAAGSSSMFSLRRLRRALF